MRSNKFWYKIAAFLIIIFLIILFLSQRLILTSFSYWRENIFHNISTFYTSVIYKENLKEENIKLKENLSQNLQKLAEIDTLKNQIEILSDQMELEIPEDESLVLGQVMNSFDLFIAGKRIINIGSVHGISENDLVISKGSLIGEIENVYKYTSEVRLLSHNESTYSVKLEDGSLATVSGSFDNKKLLVSEIMRDSNVGEGSFVVLAPTILHSSRTPVLIGIIESFINVKEEPYLQAIISPVLDYEYLKDVFVIRSK